MEIKVKPKVMESTILATKDEDEIKKMKECVVIGQETEEEISTKGQETMKILEGLRQNPDEIKQDDSKNESRSSSSSPSSSSSSTSSLSSQVMIKKLENDKNPSQNEVNTKKEEEKKKENNTNFSNMQKTSSHVWDCGSTLYDSFELNSFKRQLDSAISASARTMSMSHLPDHRIPETLPPPPPRLETSSSSSSSSGNKKHSNKISRSLHRFLKSVFRPKHHQSVSSSSTPSPVYKAAGDKDRYYVVYDKSGMLTTIPESTEKEVGPEINSLVRKTVSERFPASRVVGISCA